LKNLLCHFTDLLVAGGSHFEIENESNKCFKIASVNVLMSKNLNSAMFFFKTNLPNISGKFCGDTTVNSGLLWNIEILKIHVESCYCDVGIVIVFQLKVKAS